MRRNLPAEGAREASRNSLQVRIDESRADSGENRRSRAPRIGRFRSQTGYLRRRLLPRSTTPPASATRATLEVLGRAAFSRWRSRARRLHAFSRGGGFSRTTALRAPRWA